jgi:Rps23 Pro-64 3,4-dihydroxylase Tpa1-like proline 4-hydroxylase
MTQTLLELKPGCFIFEKKQALPADVCTEIIDRFEKHPDDQYSGRIGQQAIQETEIKRSTDLVVSNKPHWKDIDKLLFSSLDRSLREFNQLYPYFRGAFKDMGYAVQRTNSGEFYEWHIDGGSHEFAQRQLVAIWYLNDVPGPGGETEFRHQDIKIKPEAGKLILFPPFWTHEHRGRTLQAGSKYIATTWVVFA